jgi:hypothetical protein
VPSGGSSGLSQKFFLRRKFGDKRDFKRSPRIARVRARPAPNAWPEILDMAKVLDSCGFLQCRQIIENSARRSRA